MATTISKEEQVWISVDAMLRAMPATHGHQDRAGETLLRTMEAWRTGVIQGAPEAYARTIYRNLATDEQRRSARRSLHRDDAAKALMGSERANTAPTRKWDNEEELRAKVRTVVLAEVRTRAWPYAWWSAITRLQGDWTQETETTDAQRRKERKRSLAHFNVQQRKAEQSGELDAAFADAFFDAWTHRAETRRGALVAALCTHSPLERKALPEDARSPTARDLGLAALVVGDWPDLADWKNVSEAEVIEKMAEGMRAAHRAAGLRVCPLSTSAKR